MNEIYLSKLKLKTFTEQDALDYCQINSINPDNITKLSLFDNELTDISGIKLFKNLKGLWINYNKIKDISVLKDLINLKELYISNNKIKGISVIKNLIKLESLGINNLELNSDQIKYIKYLENLKILYCYSAFKDMAVLKGLNKNIEIDE